MHQLTVVRQNYHSRMMFTNTSQLPNHSSQVILLKNDAFKYFQTPNQSSSQLPPQMMFTNTFQLPNHSSLQNYHSRMMVTNTFNLPDPPCLVNSPQSISLKCQQVHYTPFTETAVVLDLLDISSQWQLSQHHLFHSYE